MTLKGKSIKKAEGYYTSGSSVLFLYQDHLNLKKTKTHTHRQTLIVDIRQGEILVGHTDILLQFETVTKCDYLR